MQTAPNFSDTIAAAPIAAHALPIGCRLRDYELTAVIGQDAWSTVYLAWDGVLQRQVALKEYLPLGLVTRATGASAVILPPEAALAAYQAGLKSFIGEARLLARFDHPSLLKVYRFWEENDTAYTVSPFHDGPTLAATLAGLGRVPSESELRTWVRPVLNALALLHQGGQSHLNVSPDEIVLVSTGPVLLAPEAARRAVAQVRGMSAGVLKPGYAAPEQYAASPIDALGPASDLYALAAVVYAAITGAPPQAADERRADDRVQPLALLAAGLYDDGFLKAIDAALALDPAQRPASDAAWRRMLGEVEVDEGAVVLLPPSDPMQQPFIGDDGGRREITVPDHPLLIAEPSAPLPEPAAPARTKAPLRMPAGGATTTPPAPADWADTQQFGETSPPKRRRSWYGVVAAVCAVVGIGALVLQYASRQADRSATPPARGPVLAPASAATARASDSALVPAPLATAASAPIAAPVTVPIAAPAAASSTATVAGPAASSAVPAPRPLVAVPVPGAASPVSRSPAAAVAQTSTTLPTPVTDQERQARCTEILQKASLEQITAAETAYFKRECK